MLQGTVCCASTPWLFCFERRLNAQGSLVTSPIPFIFSPWNRNWNSTPPAYLCLLFELRSVGHNIWLSWCWRQSSETEGGKNVSFTWRTQRWETMQLWHRSEREKWKDPWVPDCFILLGSSSSGSSSSMNLLRNYPILRKLVTNRVFSFATECFTKMPGERVKNERTPQIHVLHNDVNRCFTCEMKLSQLNGHGKIC